MKNEEDNVKNLVKKLQARELTPEEAYKRLEERGLVEDERWEFIPWVVYFILWLPLNFKFSARLPVISFPAIIIYISLVLVAIGTFFLVWAIYYHRTRGGLKKAGEAIIFHAVLQDFSQSPKATSRF